MCSFVNMYMSIYTYLNTYVRMCMAIECVQWLNLYNNKNIAESDCAVIFFSSFLEIFGS